MPEIFSETNHDNANTFLLVLISVVLLGCLLFFVYKKGQQAKKNKKKYNYQYDLKSRIGSHSFISF